MSPPLLLGLLLMSLTSEIQFRVVGAESLPARRLLDELNPWLDDLRTAPDDVGALDDAVFELSQIFRRNGFPRVEVRSRLEEINGQPVVSFFVNEGPQQFVGEVRYVGLVYFEEARFQGIFSWTRRGLLGTGKAVFSENQLRAGLAGMRLIYHLEGFLDASIHADWQPRLEDPPRDKEILIDVIVTVNEGSRTRLHAVEIEGEPETPEARIRAAIGAQIGNPFTPRMPLEIASRVEQVLADLGFFNARVQSSSRPEGPQERTVILRIEEGDLATIGKVEIVGNERTREAWIRRRTEFAVGDVFRRSAFEDTRRILLNTGLFKNVIVTGERDPQAPDRLVVTIQIEEKEAIRLGFRVGFGSYELGRVGAEIRHQNLFGVGLEGRVEGKVSFRGEEAEVTLRYPFILRQRLALQLRNRYVRFEEVSFDRQEVTTTLGVEASIVEKVRLFSGYEIRDQQIHNPDVMVSAEFTEDTRSALLFAELRRDSRDFIVNPRRGTRLSLRTEFADKAIASELDFVRLTGGATAVWEIATNWILVASSRVGWIRPHGSDEIPLSERFFLGGSRSVRSFREGELGPTDAGNEPIGGEGFVLGNLELRYPIWRAFRGAVFVDSGSLVRNNEDLGTKGHRSAAGAGFILETPVGPLRVDGAVTLNRGHDEDGWAIHVLFGHPF